MDEKKRNISAINKLLIKQFGKPKRQNPLPEPLDTLIATILSQNTNDNNSFLAYTNLKNFVKRWDELSRIRRTTIEKLIRVGGLAKQKSYTIKNLIASLIKKNEVELNTLKKLDDENAIEYLIAYKGIGVKTASCVLLFSLDRNICPVDTHVHRTLNRIGIVKEKTPDKTFYSLNRILPDGIAHSLHTNLIRLGREICKPTKPVCSACSLNKICQYSYKNYDSKIGKTKDSFFLLDNV